MPLLSEGGGKTIGGWRMILPSTTKPTEMMPHGRLCRRPFVRLSNGDASTEEQEARFARERRELRRPAAPSLTVADVEVLIDETLQAERAAVLPLLADIVNEALAEARQRHKSELREQERELATINLKPRSQRQRWKRRSTSNAAGCSICRARWE